MSRQNDSVRKQVGGFPTGSNKLAGKEFTVIHHAAQKAPEPSIFDGFELFTALEPAKEPPFAWGVKNREAAIASAPVRPNVPFQALGEAVERWIKREGL